MKIETHNIDGIDADAARYHQAYVAPLTSAGEVFLTINLANQTAPSGRQQVHLRMTAAEALMQAEELNKAVRALMREAGE